MVNLCENCEAVLWHQKAISWLSLGCPFITYVTWLLLGHLSKKNQDLKQQMILTKVTWSLRHNSHALSSACVQCAVMHHEDNCIRWYSVFCLKKWCPRSECSSRSLRIGIALLNVILMSLSSILTRFNNISCSGLFQGRGCDLLRNSSHVKSASGSLNVISDENDLSWS